MTKQRTVWDEQVEGFLEAYEKTFVSMTDEWGQLSPRVSNATKAVMMESILNGGLVSPSAKIFLTNAKNWPENEHHDHYDVALGWTFLGKDDKYDYYVNHAWEYLSIVYGGEDSQYKSPDYHSFLEGAYKSYPYAKLRELIQSAQPKMNGKTCYLKPLAEEHEIFYFNCLDPTAVFSYTRDDGFTVTCHGEIGETPQLRIILSDSPDIDIQMGVTYLDKGQTLKTWRAWTKFLNKHSQYASRITRIESTNRSLKTTNSEK